MNQDLISRQAILKHIEKIRQGALMMDDTRRASIIMNGMNLCEEAVRNQPSAQPEKMQLSTEKTQLSEEDATKEIQDILEYLDTVLHPIISPDYWNVYSELHDMISMLPFTQPEIIYCKDCVKHNKGHGYYLDGTVIGIKDCCPLVEIRGFAQGHEFDYQYCAYAERRQDGTRD